MDMAFFIPANVNFDRFTVTKVADGTIMSISGDSGLVLIADELREEADKLLAGHGITITPVCQFVCSGATAYRYDRDEE